MRWKGVLVVTGIAGAALAASVIDWTAEKLPDDLALCLTEARKANAGNDLEREQRVLLHAETLEGEAKDAAEVQRSLAVLDWKYRHRFDEARTRLLRAAEDGAQPAKAWIALARMEQARDDHAAARTAAVAALDVAEKESERRAATLARARASVEEAAALRRGGEVGTTEFLPGAFDDLYARVQSESGEIDASHLLLRAALLLDRGAAALVAWRSYYHVAPGGPAPNAIAGAAADLERILPSWNGPDATPAERIELVQALAGTRFFAEAALVALDPHADDAVRESSEVRPLLAYAAAIRKVREVTDEFYRRTIRGEGNSVKLERQVKAQAAPVLEALGVDLETPPTDDEVAALLHERFGAYVNFGSTAGYADLHMGHRVIDETRTVRQYGHEADLRFVVLDGMVSNGFQSWAWEGGSQHGGWAGPDTIWQVRPPYAEAAILVWRQFHSDQELAERDERMERETSLDDDRAREDPYGYLPGLAMRLQLQGIRRVEERVPDRLAFLAEYERSDQESSIFAHEGRHAIDKRIGTKMNAWKTEYYAKLSEVAFATDPRLALGSIFTASIGDATPHGRANAQIMKDAVTWMKNHRAEIEGLDEERPLLPQFDLLSDEQIRELFRSVDPLAS